MRRQSLYSDKALVPVIISLALVLLSPLLFHFYLDSHSTKQIHDSAQSLPVNLGNVLPVVKLQEIAAGADPAAKVRHIELQNANEGLIYKIVYTNGQTKVYDAYSGSKLGEYSQKPSTDTTALPDGFVPGQDFTQARDRAANEYPDSTIQSLVMTTTSGVVVYHATFSDGSTVDINASTGFVVNSQDDGSTSDSAATSSLNNSAASVALPRATNQTPEKTPPTSPTSSPAAAPAPSPSPTPTPSPDTPPPPPPTPSPTPSPEPASQPQTSTTGSQTPKGDQVMPATTAGEPGM